MSLIFLPIFKTFYPETYIDITHSSFVHTIVFVWIKGLLLIEREREREQIITLALKKTLYGLVADPLAVT